MKRRAMLCIAGCWLLRRGKPRYYARSMLESLSHKIQALRYLATIDTGYGTHVQRIRWLSRAAQLEDIESMHLLGLQKVWLDACGVERVKLLSGVE